MTAADTGLAIDYKNPEIGPDETFAGSELHLPFGFGPLPSNLQNKKIFYFDIDNCLYGKSTRIPDLMSQKISQFFKDYLKLSENEAKSLHENYYRQYGLALEGLVRNHKVDALDYNSKVDDAIDLKSVLSYNQKLRDLLLKIKKEYDFDLFWLVTNAYKNHALRVVTFLGLGDLFDGLTYCDYSKIPLVCKPQPEYFEGFLTRTNIDQSNRKYQFFIDDSEINVKSAFDLGFGNIIHFVEDDTDIEKMKSKLDYEKYYGNGDNSDFKRIKVLRSILDLEKVL